MTKPSLTYQEILDAQAVLKRTVGLSPRRKELRKKWWVGFDLDGTLAHELHGDERSPGAIGAPIARTVALARSLVQSHPNCVKVFTARVCEPLHPETMLEEAAIRKWTELHLGVPLPSTAVKDFGCLLIIDDRALNVNGHELPPLTSRLHDEAPAFVKALELFTKELDAPDHHCSNQS